MDWFKWAPIIVPAAIVAGFAWKFFRPACETFIVYILRSRLDTVDESCDRIGILEDKVNYLEAALSAQGVTLRDHIAQVFTPLQKTLEKMEGTLERIAEQGTHNASAIENLRGLWDGSERRSTRRRSTD